MRRTAPPARWLTPIHVPRTARRGNGRPPERAPERERAAETRPDEPDWPARPVPPARAVPPERAVVGRVVGVARAGPGRGVEDGRVAMLRPYGIGPTRPMNHTRDTSTGPTGLSDGPCGGAAASNLW